MRRLSALAVLLSALAGCGEPPFPSSGNADADKTAKFLASVIEDARRAKRFKNSTDLAEWMVSIAGKAEIIPPDPRTEPSAAEYYHGLYPSDKAWYGAERAPEGWHDMELIVSADAKKDKVVVEAYKKGEDNPFYTWEF